MDAKLSFTRVVVIVVSLALCGSIFPVSVLIYSYWNPSVLNLAYGPFHGVDRSEGPSRKPDQEFVFCDGMTLEAYDAKEDEVGATVRLRDRNGTTRWTIYAAPGEVPGTPYRVEKIRFFRSLVTPFKAHVLADINSPNLGKGWWFISKNGDLEGYWYDFTYYL